MTLPGPSEPTYQDDQLNQTLAAHQAADGEALSPQEPVRPGGEGSARDLANKGAGNDGNDISPSNAVIQKT